MEYAKYHTNIIATYNGEKYHPHKGTLNIDHLRIKLERNMLDIYEENYNALQNDMGEDK